MTILEIQKRLMALGYPLPKFGADGKPGAETAAAIKAFQEAAGLVADGIAGPQTQIAMARAAAPVKGGRAEPDKAAMNAPVPEVAASSSSKAVAPPNVGSLKLLDTARPIHELIWHCTATPEGKDYTVDDVRAWHKARGWSDIGYHYIVYRDGRIMLGRPVGQIGAHVEGRNTGTIGCSYIGGLSADSKVAKDTRTPAQRASMLWLTEQLAAKFGGITKISGHNQYAAKACPSFDVRKDALGAIV